MLIILTSGLHQYFTHSTCHTCNFTLKLLYLSVQNIAELTAALKLKIHYMSGFVIDFINFSSGSVFLSISNSCIELCANTYERQLCLCSHFRIGLGNYSRNQGTGMYRSSFVLNFTDHARV
jgi:hypothetical protein